jgi:sterol desaturase/sphingolipid hydroxylase (fatty acid hydroxylase superfamily)
VFIDTQFCRVLPEFHWVVAELVGCILVEEVLFYYSHWLLHHKRYEVRMEGQLTS